MLLWLLAYSSFADAPQIQKGTLDLRGLDLAEKPILIGGETIFEWERLTSTPAAISNTLYQIPEIWDNDTLGSDIITRFGYGTYHFQIILPEGTTLQKQELGLGMHDIYCAYALFINEKSIGGSGIVATSEADYNPYWKPEVIRFIPTSDTLQVALQVANYSHSKGGIREALMFGEAQMLESIYDDNRAYDYMLTGCLLMGGLFFLGLYFFGRNEYSMLLFSLFCLSYAYRIIGAKNYALHHLVSDIPWLLTIKIEYLTLFLSAGLFIAYSYHLYPKETSKKFYIGFTAISAFLCLITLITPPIFFTQLLTPFFGLILLGTPYLLYTYFLAVRNKQDGASIAAVSIIAISLSFSYDILAYLGFFTKNNFVIFLSYVTFFFLQSLILSYRFAVSFKKAVSKAEQAAIAKSDFLSTMSHEIRTPLNAVIGLTNLLQVNKGHEENLESIRFSAQNLLQLINEILDYAKIDAGKIDFEQEPANIKKLMLQLANAFRSRMDKKLPVELIADVDKNIPDLVLCDITRLSQVLTNLISNAIKFTNSGYVKIKIEGLSQTTGKVKIKFSVIDTGIGIPEEKQDYIFDTFTQASSSTTRQYGGTGLGLSISKRLLEMQNVSIELQSKPGFGSTFSFTQEFNLPAEKSLEASMQVHKKLEENLLTDKKILLVEDNHMNIVVATKFLEKWKAKIDVAESGQEALDKIKDHDLVLMDLQMPEMDGYTTCKIMRRNGVSIPIVALTASALLDVRQKVIASGMNDYVTKPFDPDELYEKIVKQLNKNVA